MGVFFRDGQNWHLIGDGQAVSFQSDNFPWMIGEHAQVLEAEVDQNLRADAAFMLQHAQAREHIRQTVGPGTILALPTAPCIAPAIDMPAAEMEQLRVRVMRLTCIAGLAGLPQVNIPVGTLSGCPIGLSLIGWEGGDEALLDLACELSRHCGMAAAHIARSVS